MPVTGYSIQLVAALLDGTSTYLSPGTSAETGTVTEAAGGLPASIAAGASDVNIKLGTVTQPKFLAVWGAQGISFKIYNTSNVALEANPFAFLSDTDTGLGNLSEIWVTNTDSQAHSITFLAGE